MSDIEELRARRMQELMAKQSQQQAQEQEVNQQIKLIISKILSPEARSRLGNIRAANPEYARQVEVLLIQLAQSGRLPKEIGDEQLKQILLKIKEGQRETKIEFK